MKKIKFKNKGYLSKGLSTKTTYIEKPYTPKQPPYSEVVKEKIHPILEKITSLVVDNPISGGSILKKIDYSKLEFYDIIEGTSPNSKYVVVAISKKEGGSVISIRFKNRVLSVRAITPPKNKLVLEGLRLAGLEEKFFSDAGHLSCHLAIHKDDEFDHLKRYYHLFKSLLGQHYDITDWDINKIIALGA